MNIKKIASGVAAISAVMAVCIVPATADPVTFADFNLRGGAANPFKYTNTGTNSLFTVTGQIPVTFTYQVSNAYGATGAPINALLSFTAQVNGPVVPPSPGSTAPVSEEMKNVSFVFSAVNPGATPGTNLLTLTSSSGQISGRNGGRTLSFAGDTGLGDTVAYSSNFLSFSNTIARDYNFSFTSVTPKLGVQQTGTPATGQGYFNTFTASGTGTFDSDPAPLNPVPEPAPVAAFLIGGMGLALVAFRGRKASRLTA